MHEFWYGKRYNELLTKFNKINPQLNTMLELVVRKLPYVLELIANNYSLVDCKQKETLENNEEPNRIKELVAKNDVGMKFVSEKVNNMQQEISKCFERAKEQMNQMEIEYRKIVWKSESAKLLEQEFGKLKSEIVVLLENTNVEFKKLMAQAENDMETIEKIIKQESKKHKS